MRSRFTYIGESVIEVVVDGDSLTWNVLQPESTAAGRRSLVEAAHDPTATWDFLPSDPAAAAPVAPPPEALPLESPPVPAAAPEPSPVPVLDEVEAPMTLAAAPTKKQRTSKGVIRAMWTAVFSFGGEALVYGLNNLTALNLPPGVGLAVGAVGYGAKAAIFPNSKL